MTGFDPKIINWIISGVAVATKGDVPGHEFHGNQYDEGGGSRPSENESSSSRDAGIENKVNAKIRTQSQGEAESHGYKLDQRIRLDEESFGVLTATSSGLMVGIEDTSGKIGGYMRPSWGEINRWNKK